MKLTRRYRFAAAHRLHSPQLTEEQNRRLYGKCNNPFGHGHDYLLEVAVEGPVQADGFLASREAMDELVRSSVLEHLDHKDLNRDVPELEGVATTENLARLVERMLLREWTLPAKLASIRIAETDRNTFELEAVGK